MKKDFVPKAGDLILLNFNPASGHEQQGYRPALVISPKEYNQKTGLAVMCPLTSQIKGYPFEVLLPGGCDLEGAVLCDQIKNLSWKARGAKLAGHVPLPVLNEVKNLLRMFLDLG